MFLPNSRLSSRNKARAIRPEAAAASGRRARGLVHFAHGRCKLAAQAGDLLLCQAACRLGRLPRPALQTQRFGQSASAERGTLVACGPWLPYVRVVVLGSHSVAENYYCQDLKWEDFT